MKKITVELTPEELEALLTLTENQFFRIKFIDPKMPGSKGRPAEVECAQSAVAILKEALRKQKGFNKLLPVTSSTSTFGTLSKQRAPTV
jgi:hypothetical protein